MHCPACTSRATSERSERTELGYRRFRCRDCGRGFNERSGTVFNRLQHSTDVICLVVLGFLGFVNVRLTQRTILHSAANDPSFAVTGPSTGCYASCTMLAIPSPTHARH